MSNILNLKGVKFFAIAVLAVAVLATFGLVAVQTASADCSINSTLRMGSTGAEVVCLQTALGGLTADGNFGPMTKAAVMSFQRNSGLVADGVFGPMSRAVWLANNSGMGGNFPSGCTSNAGYSTTTGMSCAVSTNLPAGCSSTSGYSPTTGMSCSGGSSSNNGSLTGGAGSVDSYDLASGLSNEEVGEDGEDVKVAGLEIENGDSSDLNITAVRLVFDEGTAGSDFDNYASEVSVWLGSKKVATVDADEFNDDNNWTRTVSLNGAMIGSGDTESLYVAISGVSNLDSADATDTWTVDFTSVRFVDATGASTSEDPTVAATTFSFESFATSQDTEVKITESGSANELVNDAHLINVDATDTTDNVPILAFDIEVEGDSDVNIDSLPVTLTSTETTGDDPDDLITTLRLFADGVEIGSETLLTTDANGSTEVVVFDDLDFDINAGDKVNFVVKAKFVALSGALDLNDTIQATFGETETDLATFDAEDETGENLADADKTGTAASDASTVRDVGFALKYISSTAVLSHAADLTVATDDDQGTFAVTFDVTAFDGAVYIDGTSPALTGGGTILDLTVNATAGTPVLNAATITSPTGATLTGTANADARFLVAEDDTERFTVTVVLTPSADATVSMQLADIVYALTDVTGTLSYTFDLGDFKSPDLYLNQN